MSLVVIDKLRGVEHKLPVTGAEQIAIIKRKILAKSAPSEYTNRQIYVNVPFCMFHCSFCVYRGQLLPPPDRINCFVEELALEAEELSASFRGFLFNSIFIGGGTVTILSDKQLLRLLRAIRNSFSLDLGDGEFTVELAPHGLSEKKLETIASQKANRVTIGIQSLENELLTAMNRPIKSLTYLERMFTTMRGLPFRDINADLMVSIRGRNYENLLKDFNRLADWGCTSIMVYIEMRVYRDRTKTQEICEAKAMVRKLAAAVIDRFSLNGGMGVNEYNRFTLRDRGCENPFRTRYSTNYEDPDVLCLGLGSGARSWNREWAVLNNLQSRY
ncbi:MAG: radical SAM protein [Pseudomonadota bacterium]